MCREQIRQSRQGLAGACQLKEFELQPSFCLWKGQPGAQRNVLLNVLNTLSALRATCHPAIAPGSDPLLETLSPEKAHLSGFTDILL